MTLHQFFDYLSGHPLLTLAAFVFPPVMALFVAHFGRGRGYESPWRQVYAVLIYAVCIPGILCGALLTYLFLFEQQSVWDVNILTQVVPVVSMAATLIIIRQNVDLAYVPGFGRLSGLLAMIFGLIALMFVADRTRLILFSYMPFVYVLLLFVGLLVLLNWGWRRVTSAAGVGLLVLLLGGVSCSAAG